MTACGLSCPPLSPRAFSNSWPLTRWCHPTISTSVTPFSSFLQSFPASRSFPMSRFFASGGQSTGASASATVLPMNIQGWFPLRLAGLILQSRPSTAIWKHHFFGAQSYKQNSFILCVCVCVCANFFVDSSGFSLHTIRSYTNSYHLVSFFPGCMSLFLSLAFMYCLAVSVLY